jgi:flagellar protein FlbD
MITVHRIGHQDEPLAVNPDLIVSMEAHPDTVVTFATGMRIVIAETPGEVAEAVRAWRASVLAAGLELGGVRALAVR